MSDALTREQFMILLAQRWPESVPGWKAFTDHDAALRAQMEEQTARAENLERNETYWRNAHDAKIDTIRDLRKLLTDSTDKLKAAENDLVFERAAYRTDRGLRHTTQQQLAEAQATIARLKHESEQQRQEKHKEAGMCYGGCECERCHPSENKDVRPMPSVTAPRRVLTSHLDRVRWFDVTAHCQLGPAVGSVGMSLRIRLPHSTVEMDLLHPANRKHFHLAYDRTFRVWTNLEEYAS